MSVWFRLDLASAQTDVCRGDVDLPDRGTPPLDDAVVFEGAAGLLTTGISSACILTLTQEDGRYETFPIDLVLLDGPPGKSRLGLDVLARTVLVFDPGSDSVFLEPLS